MQELPFTPSSARLKDILRRKYILPLSRWLLGSGSDTITAQQTGSIWEAALSLMVLNEFADIFASNGEEEQLRGVIADRSIDVALWLMEQRKQEGPCCWEEVTWDTAVVVRALLTVLERYPSRFSKEQKDVIQTTVCDSVEWLKSRFVNWERETKYPFGPADVAQIAITLIYILVNFPDIVRKAEARVPPGERYQNLMFDIIRYLLHIKTDKSITLQLASDETENQSIVTCWWDDYFSTAEVVEALGTFHQYCAARPELSRTHAELLSNTRRVLIKACAYFEQGQVDGTWGSHVDTIKVITVYVTIRRMIPQVAPDYDEPLVVPEIHTTFKALRWICDDKQIFSDGSFMHTMFLTIFYASALVAVHQSWLAAERTVDQLYDDVVWFSPTRTTPERAKRLSLTLRYISVHNELARSREREAMWRRIFLTIGLTLLVGVIFIGLGQLSGILTATIGFTIPAQQTNANIGNFYGYASIIVTIYLALVAVIWNPEIRNALGARSTRGGSK